MGAMLMQAGVVLGTQPCLVRADASGDAGFRLSDYGGDAPVPASGPIDLLEVRVGAWTTPTPTVDPYSGDWAQCSSATAELLRMDLVVAGIVNPPGTLTGAGQPNPFAFGPLPLYGFIELDVDDNPDTGGEVSSAAVLHRLANAARFGARPSGPTGDRAVTLGGDLDGEWLTEPFYERSGADFVMTFCGCAAITLISQSGDMDGQFEAGETFVVRSRFFQRAGGYRQASIVLGGSTVGAYDPTVNIRFQHDIPSDRTTVSLVYGLTNAGAALLAGQAVEPNDARVSNQTSVAEGVQDLINRSTSAGLQGLARELVYRWEGMSTHEVLNPALWRASAIIGTTYLNSLDGLYTWTDLGFDCVTQDVNGDGVASEIDATAILSAIAQLDGTADDADGVVNSIVTIGNFPVNFTVYDANYDGLIDVSDVNLYPPGCDVDWNQSGHVTLEDLLDFFDAWSMLNGSTVPPGTLVDFNGNELVDLADLLDFFDAWTRAC